MLMYCKLFASLYQGTLRGCSDEILVFTNLLAHADQHGIVDKHWRAIAEETGLSRERVEAAILKLEEPDPESRSPEQDGRRIVRIDEHRAWGWQVVNYGKYRAIRNEDDRREQNRLAQQRFREKNKQSKPPSSQAEAEAEAVNLKALSGKPDVSAQKEEKQRLKAEATEILAFLNEKAGKAFRPVDTNLDFIIGRLKSGMTSVQARQIIIRKHREWAGTDMEAYLRPATLFNKTNCEQYLGELVAK